MNEQKKGAISIIIINIINIIMMIIIFVINLLGGYSPLFGPIRLMFFLPFLFQMINVLEITGV